MSHQNLPRSKKPQGLLAMAKSSIKVSPRTVKFVPPPMTNLSATATQRRASLQQYDRQDSQFSEVLSPSMAVSHRRERQFVNQIRKPLADADHEEAFAESEGMSSLVIGDDDLLWTNRDGEDPRSPQPLVSQELNQMTSLSASQVRLNQNVINPLSQSQHVINAEQLMHVLKDSNEQSIDGYLTINGMSFKLVAEQIQTRDQHHQRVSVNPMQTMNRESHVNDTARQFDINRVPSLGRILPRELLMEPQSSINFYQNPMNEQRSTDAPIVSSNSCVNLDRTSSRIPFRPASQLQQDPEDDQYADFALRTGFNYRQNQNLSQTMAIGQGLTSQILPKISQTISGDSLQPSQPSDSFELSPERSLSVLRQSLLDKTQSSGVERDLPVKNFNLTKINNFVEIKEHDNDSQTEPESLAWDQNLENGPPSSATEPNSNSKAESYVTVSQIQAELESPHKSTTDMLSNQEVDTNLPQIGTLNLSARKKKKKAAKKSVLISVETPQVSAQLEQVEQSMTVSVPSKKKKKFKITINTALLASDSPMFSNKEMQKPVQNVVTVRKPPTPKGKKPSTPKLNRIPTPKMDSAKSMLDDFLNGLEAEISKPKAMKRTTQKAQQSAIKGQQVCLDDFDKEFMKANLKRNNSDGIRSKDELKTKKIILRELQDLKESLFYQQDHEKSEIDIGFLHASPIFIEGPNEGKTSLVALKFQEEKAAIIEAIKASNQHIRFKQSVATKDKFIDMIRKRPQVLHISCHGFDQSDTSMKLLREEDLRNLLFETENGDGKLISQRELSKILKQATTKIKLVFVAACMSQFVGEIFQQCDVPHVICAQQGKAILDAAAISFSNSFYTNFFSGETVCKAFNLARDEVSVKYSDEEANRFQLMKSTGQYKHVSKRCTTRWPQKEKEGILDCKSEHIKYKNMRAKLTSFIPREIEFFKLVKFIQNEHKLAHYRGLPGVGKTYLVRNVLHYLSERKYFSAGIIYVPLNDTKSVPQFLSTLRNQAISFFKMNSKERFEFRKTVQAETCMQDFLVSFFEDKALPHFELKKQRNFSKSKKRRFLLVLDNCDDLIDFCGDEFRNLLSFFCDETKMLKILVVSRKELGDSIEGEQIQQILPQLGSKQAVQFFLDVLKQENRSDLKLEEIADLILGYPFYPIAKAIPYLGLMAMPKDGDLNQEFKAKFTKTIDEHLGGIDYNRKLVDLLSHHDLFRLLQGNPTSISRAANVYLFTSDVTHSLSLLDLYNTIKEQNIDSEVYNQQTDDTRPKPKFNNQSVEASTRMAIDMLPCTDCKSLLYFLGCLPAGVTRKQLNQMWDQDKVEKDLSILLKNNLVEKSNNFKSDEEKRIELNPVLCQFISQDINQKDLEQFMKEIIEYYTVQLQSIHKQIAFMRETSDGLDGMPEVAIGDSPMISPRKQQTFTTQLSSFYQSSDSLSREQLSELKAGLSKKSFETGPFGGRIGTGLFSNSSIEISLSQQIQQECPNVQRCIEYLCNLTSSEYAGDLERSQVDFPSNIMEGLRQSSIAQNFAASSVSQKSFMSSKPLHIALSAKRMEKRINDQRQAKQEQPFLRMNSQPSQSSSSNKSPGIQLQPPNSAENIFNESPIQQSSSVIKRTTLQQIQKQRRQTVAPSSLYVIPEDNEKPDFNNTNKTDLLSRDSHEMSNKQQIEAPKMQKIDSSPFQYSCSYLDSSSPKSGGARADKLSRTLQVLTGMEEMTGVKTISRITDSIGKCNIIMKTLKDRENDVSKVGFGNVSSMVKSNRQILEDGCDTSSDSVASLSDYDDNDDDAASYMTKDQTVFTGNQQSESDTNVLLSLGKKPVPKLAVMNSGGHSINVSHMNLESDRSERPKDASVSAEIDPLASVRSGDDFDDDTISKVSELQYDQMGSFNNRDMAKEIQVQNFDSSAGSDPQDGNFTTRQNTLQHYKAQNDPNEIDQFVFMDQQAAGMLEMPDRRHTVNHTMRRQSGLVTKNFNGHSPVMLKYQYQQDASATMNPLLLKKGSLIERVSKGVRKSIKRKIQLDQSANFTINSFSHRGKEKSHVALPNKRFSDTAAKGSGGSGSEKKPVLDQMAAGIDEKMSSYGEFIIYAVANSLLAEDIAFAYQITSTDFSKFAGSILFEANLLRLKALASERIYIQYLDPKDPESNLELSCYLTEAIYAATNALNLYSGESVGGLTNRYGRALSNFHLGYLFVEYSTQLSKVKFDLNKLQIETSLLSQCKDKPFDKGDSELSEIIGVELPEEILAQQARDYFQMAFKDFEKTNHLKGMYMAKQYEEDLSHISLDNIDINHGSVTKKEMSAQQLRQDYFNWIKKYDYKHCCHIPRQHGDVISLITEIVDNNKKDSILFKILHRATQQEESKDGILYPGTEDNDVKRSPWVK